MMMRFRWPPWCACDPDEHAKILQAILQALKRIDTKLDAALATTVQAAVLTEALRAHTDALRQSLAEQPKPPTPTGGTLP